MAPKRLDRAHSPDTPSAIDLAEKHGDLLMFPHHEELDEIFGDALDQPPTRSNLILDENHPLFARALICYNLEDFLDFLTHTCLSGRQRKENPLAFTHVTPSAAHALALKAMSLNVANVFGGVKDRQDTRVAQDKSDVLLNISPNRLVALVPVFDPGQQKRIDVMHVMDPREGGLDDGKPDPLAAVISVGEVGYPHADAGYWKALQTAQAPSKSLLREIRVLFRASLLQHRLAARRAMQGFFERGPGDDSDDGDLN